MFLVCFVFFGQKSLDLIFKGGTLFGVGHYSRLGHYSNNYGMWNSIVNDPCYLQKTPPPPQTSETKNSYITINVRILFEQSSAGALSRGGLIKRGGGLIHKIYFFKSLNK